ncbi:hypothetical protein PUNSTDRAFT_128940 [Punctularia strigosozonata HHB-11173 SS5]|uniref:uncharacterized protein n=1 Tax=Punctularia strigosozonata (strain HHB-11173) TaxID=741275 RepID=UPI0004417DE1|nr:uncharacterized protein PUNSTDRAFT_128940 [Punctularia strigosozonata HHB-11173 SS5]EIN13253.1 hypothetical protein PUNSTDRAFT_128940 [Punctularia strigosozonata HHB-11173 SS5]
MYKIELVGQDDPILKGCLLKAAYDQVLTSTSLHHANTPTTKLYFSHKIFLLIMQTAQLDMDAHACEEAGGTSHQFFMDLPSTYYPTDGFAISKGQPLDSNMQLKLPICATSLPGFLHSIHNLYKEAPYMYRPLSAPTTSNPPILEYPKAPIGTPGWVRLGWVRLS